MMATDWRCLVFAAREMADCIGDVDLHELACEYANRRGEEEAGDADYINAFKEAVARLDAQAEQPET